LFEHPSLRDPLLDAAKLRYQDVGYSEGKSDMTILSIKSNIYFDPEIHQALRLRATDCRTSMSALVNEAVRQVMNEDLEDLAAFTQRAPESEITRKALLANLKRHGKL
jgi:hypothetical protein